MDDLDLPREVCIEVVYVDEHLIELAAVIRAGYWWGRGTAYTISDDITRFADALTRFAEGGPSAAFQAGADTATDYGLIELLFYRIDRAGHIACHGRLASSSGPRPEQKSRLAVEFGAEAEAVGRFARQLAELARRQAGRASLVIDP